MLSFAIEMAYCIFFLKKDNKAILYEFDEFSNMLIKAAPFDFCTFNIHCPNLGILGQL
jgi:hypothetical protein